MFGDKAHLYAWSPLGMYYQEDSVYVSIFMLLCITWTPVTVLTSNKFCHFLLVTTGECACIRICLSYV